MERINLLSIAPQPWKNGAGVTREIAVEAGRSGGFDWRISVADVDRDAPFSAFPGIDRCIVLLRGAGMRLQASDSTLDHCLLTPLEPFHFSGDVALQATLFDGACIDFNVMVRRGLFTADVRCHRGEAEVAASTAMLMLCCAGEWRIGGRASPTLQPMQAMLSRRPVGPLRVRPTGGGSAARLLHVRLCHDATP